MCEKEVIYRQLQSKWLFGYRNWSNIRQECEIQTFPNISRENLF